MRKRAAAANAHSRAFSFVIVNSASLTLYWERAFVKLPPGARKGRRTLRSLSILCTVLLIRNSRTIASSVALALAISRGCE